VLSLVPNSEGLKPLGHDRTSRLARDKAAMNETQLFKAKRDSSRLMSGPPAKLGQSKSDTYRELQRERARRK